MRDGGRVTIRTWAATAGLAAFTLIGAAAGGPEWTKTVYTLPSDEIVMTVQKEFPFPAEQTLIRMVLGCADKAGAVKISLESFRLVGAAAGEPLPFSQDSPKAVAGTVKFAAQESVPLWTAFAVDQGDHVISGKVPAAQLLAQLPLVVGAGNAYGSFEVAILRDAAGLQDLAGTCAGTQGPKPAATEAAAAAVGLRTSFDCARAGTTAERLICTTPQLASADLALAGFYRRSLAASNEASVGPSQRAFIARRNQCTSVACILEAYRGRHEELAALGYVSE